MVFTKRLREGVRNGEITCAIRIWTRPHVIAGNRYRMEEGEIEIDSTQPIGLPDITPQQSRASGFLGILDLLKVAKHGRGENIYLIRFHSFRLPAPKSLAQSPQPCDSPSLLHHRTATPFQLLAPPLKQPSCEP